MLVSFTGCHPPTRSPNVSATNSTWRAHASVRFALDEEAAGRGEPAGQREVVQADPRHDARVARGGQHVAVVRDRALVVARPGSGSMRAHSIDSR